MYYLDLICVIVAWFLIVSILHIIHKFKKITFAKIYYGIAIIIRERENVVKFLSKIHECFRKIPDKLIASFSISLFLITMFILVPIPLNIIGISSFMYPMMFYIGKNLFLIIQSIFQKVSPQELIAHGFTPLQPIVPGVTASLRTFIYIIVCAGISILIHEIAHGIAALRYGVPIKSGGLFTALFILFGGFVEIDEEYLRKLKLWKRLTIYTAGVFANIVLAYIVLIVLYLLLYVTLNTGNPLGVHILKTKNSAFQTSDIIIGVDDKPIFSIYDLIFTFGDYLGKNITLTIYRSEVGFLKLNLYIPKNTTIYLLSTSKCYITNLDILVSNTVVYDFLFWMYCLNLTLAMLNTLPIIPLDGGQVIQSILEKICNSEKIIKNIMYCISSILWLALGLTIYYTLRYGFYVPAW